MPYYDYKCSKCDDVHEEKHGMSETPKVKCPKCKAKCSKVLMMPTVHHKGREIWEYNDCRQLKPKWLKSRDGKTRVRYDSSKHGFGQGMG